MIHSAENHRSLREQPPRHLDWYTQAVMLLGDRVSQAGWALLAIGSVFFWTVTVHSEAVQWFKGSVANWQDKEGVILEADSTGTVEDGLRIWRYEHSVAPGDGYRYRGVSYSVGKKFDAGQLAFIRFDADDPRNNFAVGLRRSEHRWQSSLLLLVPLFGLVLVALPLRRNLRLLRLLKIGDFTRGKLFAKTPTGQVERFGANMLPVFRFEFRFEHEGTVYHATCRTHRPTLVEDESAESILYDRFRPSFNLVYDAVLRFPKITASGKLAPMDWRRAWVLFLPMFTVVVNGVYLLLG
ncbi:MAG: hypothetical protein MUC59_09795 [Saprospiraceae bacterium]|nr:hypothetical protein [Saprospiraceae bacterium]